MNSRRDIETWAISRSMFGSMDLLMTHVYIGIEV